MFTTQSPKFKINRTYSAATGMPRELGRYGNSAKSLRVSPRPMPTVKREFPVTTRTATPEECARFGKAGMHRIAYMNANGML